MQALSRQTINRNDSSTILQTIEEGEKIAVKASLDNYGEVIWSMTTKFTDSIPDTEAVIKEIFLNIWQHAARFEQTNFDELIFVTIVARRQLRKCSGGAHQ